ncbi:hypothetical protein MF672_016905 [Actinomadura sp. ATCC 31491]|uniref:DUF2867 domain-containing protein n=1 Tax=Actinomadura luzonensis TaxID=2805427 RepID=A0ABT0FSY2_9ACTN|nr:hypothetical protein [Actinomadura luzonensis]MCK2215456.1 hypothetical protein [Actinomadura luzonensis]
MPQQTRELPAAVRALSPLGDYADVFTAATRAGATPEQWARAMFGDVPGPAGLLIWRGFLGLRLARQPSPDTVAGWRVDGRGDDWIRLAARSWFLSAHLVVTTADGHVSLATFLRYDRFPGRLVWPPLSAVHRLLVPRVLRAAVARTERHAPRG